MSLLLFLILIVILLCVIIVDWRTHTIPDRLWIALALLGVVRVAAGYLGWLGEPVPVTATDAFIGAFAASIPLFLLASLSGGFGGGDIKLMFAAGIFLGWQPVLLALFIATILGAIVGAFLLATKRATRSTKIAFGPYLAIGIAIAACCSKELIASVLTVYA
jgi:leader peptidase (prepilin peptidase)/N-methyltransferase